MRSNAIFTIFKKELARFFKDRRTLIALLMPGLLIYVVYSLMGGIMEDSLVPDEEYIPVVIVENMPDSLDDALPLVFNVTEAEENKADEYKQQVTNADVDLYVVFPESFDELVDGYTVSSGQPAPSVNIYFNSSLTNSAIAYQSFTALLTSYESQLANKFDVNMGNDTYDLATDGDMTGMLFSMLLPMLLVVLLFSGCMAVAPESISGEKERGTIATMLITPAKRSHIAIGKILALSLMALISGTSSALGVILALPKLMGGDVRFDGSVYGVTDYLMLAVVILSTVMVLITAISLISAYAKTVKEATTYVTPLMIISMLVGLSGMMGSAASNPLLYLIPIFNSVHSMIGIFSFEPDLVNMLITVGANLAVTGIGVFLLAKMFNSERIMFNK